MSYFDAICKLYHHSKTRNLNRLVSCRRKSNKINLLQGRQWIKKPSLKLPIEQSNKKASHEIIATEHSAPSLLALSQDVLHKRVDVVTIVHGKSCTLQGPNSDVKLHVPDGVHGVILAKIHTNHSKFLNLIPKSECIIGPICGYSLHKYGSHSVSKDSRYKIQIPHILKDVKSIEKHIRIRLFDSDNQITKDSTDIQYDINDKYVNVYTSHFCDIIVTAENIDCCAASVIADVFGSLRNIPDAKPLASVKIFLSSFFFQIADYRRDLLKWEELCSNPFHLLTSHEINLSSKPYDPSKSTIEIILKVQDRDVWKPFMDMTNSVKLPLNKALKYTKGHLCKSSPKQVALFYMESTKTAVHYFRGLVNLELSMNILNNEYDNEYIFLLDIVDHEQWGKKQESMKNSVDDEHELDDEKLFKLVSRIYSKHDLMHLFISLRLPLSAVDSAITLHSYNINTAAYALLKTWRNSQSNFKEAYSLMRKALTEVGMTALTEALQ